MELSKVEEEKESINETTSCSSNNSNPIDKIFKAFSKSKKSNIGFTKFENEDDTHEAEGNGEPYFRFFQYSKEADRYFRMLCISRY